MEIPVQAKEVCSRQIRCMSRKRDAERNESSEACEPCAEKSRYRVYRYPYRKPTQVDEERILRPAEEALLRNSAK